MKLPDALCRDVAGLLQGRHQDRLGPGELFTVAGEMDADGVEVTLVLDAPGGHDRAEAVCRVAVPKGAPDADAALDRALDAADAFLGSWLEGDRAEHFPVDFEEYEYGGAPVSLRFRRSRPTVETKADRLLREAGHDPDDV